MDRREYLYAASATLTAAVAGCSDSNDESTPAPDESTTEPDGTPTETTEPGRTTTEQETEPSLPSWSAWIPADVFPDEQAEITALDVQTAREQYPADAYAEFGFSDIATAYGVSESDFEDFIILSLGVEDEILAITGSYDPESVVEHLGVADDRLQTVGDYKIVDSDLAIGQSVLIIGSSYEMLLDARAGDTPTLGETDDTWRDLLGAISDGTLVSVQDGNGLADDGQSPLDADVECSGLELNSAGGQRALIRAHLMFDSEDRAQEVLDNNRQDIIDSATDETDGSLEQVERDGARIVVTIETETFNF